MNKSFLLLFFLIFFFILVLTLYSEDILLIEETLILDIQTSNYYDLVIWAEKLGLSSTGTIDNLREVLFSHYNLNYIKEVKQIQSGRSIIIKSARELNYIEDITIDQNYIILQGEVYLEMIDYDNETTHKINADKIVFNQTEKTLSAFGNITYIINRADNNEYFHGNSLVFEINTWEGIFFEGVSETDRLVENQELSSSENIKFYFSGENIYRGSSDRIELNQGSITSSKIIDPYYRLDADKIWILEPGEWAIKDATLFVGRIPVFYFPYFFLPGDELVFNPAVGYKDIEGYFINTTSFLIGLKEETADDTFSFLKSQNTELKEKYIEDLFLKTTKNDLNNELWPYNNGSNLKLYVDYYSKKGFFIGLDGKMYFDAFIKTFNIFTALSYSRYIYLDSTTDVYTPLRINESGTYVKDYEKSSFLGLSIPFRFAFDTEMSFATNWLKMDIDLPVYSDSKFRANFMNREEGLKWTELINNDKSTNDESTIEDTTEKEVSNLNWYFNSSINPSVKYFSPVIDTLSIDKLNIKLNWLSRISEHPENQLLLDNNYIYDDTFSFYYPSSLILPDVSGKIAGTLFQTHDDSLNTAEDTIDNQEFNLLKNPWDIETELPDLSNFDNLIETPELMDFLLIDIENKNKLFSNRLLYSILPSFSINSIYSSDIPLTENDIDFTSDYSILSTQTTSSLDYSFNVYESLLVFSNISIFSTNYTDHFNPIDQAEVWDSYVLQDKNATNYKLSDKIIINSRPFSHNDFLNESLFTYNLNTTLYNRYWNTLEENFQDNYFEWNEENITDHSATIEIKIDNSEIYQIIKLKTILPPENIILYPELFFYSDIITGSLKTEFQYIEDVQNNYWIYKPYEGYIQYSFFEKDFLKQTVSLDFEEMINSYGQTELYVDKNDSNLIFNENLDYYLDDWSLTKSSTDIQLWFFNFNYLMEDIVGYHFQKEEPQVWILDTESYFQPSKASSTVIYEYNPDRFWKNRLKVSLDIFSTWTMNLQKYTDTAFTFDLNLSLYIAEFLELSFKSKSVNQTTYRYFSSNSYDIGLPDLNIFTDLIKSFNFFNEEDRKASNFNLELLSFSAIHHLSDWDLNIEYSGEPVLITTNNFTEYQWKSQFSLFVTWKPVPEIKKNIDYIENELIFN